MTGRIFYNENDANLYVREGQGWNLAWTASPTSGTCDGGIIGTYSMQVDPLANNAMGLTQIAPPISAAISTEEKVHTLGRFKRPAGV